MRALNCVYDLNLPHGYIAAGFVRNLIWDHLHEFDSPSQLNDVDVIFFDRDETNFDISIEYEKYLSKKIPELNWQVRNQVIMHERNEDPPYEDVVDAMSYWPEKETATLESKRKTLMSLFFVKKCR